MALLSPACREHLDAIAIPRHASWDPVGLMTVRSYMREQQAELGNLEEHSFRRGSHEGVNLILKLPGRNSRRRPLLVGTPYDGLMQSIGADDNASAAAALLELGRRWSIRPPRHDQTLWQPRRLHRADSECPRCLDALQAHPCHGKHVKSKPLPAPRADIDVSAVRRSDHIPLWDQG